MLINYKYLLTKKKRNIYIHYLINNLYYKGYEERRLGVDVRIILIKIPSTKNAFAKYGVVCVSI